MRLASFALFASLAAACAAPGASRDVHLTSGSPPDPCDGLAFDADDPDPRCLRHAPSASPPDPADIAVSVRGATVVKSGEAASVVVELRNTTDAPVTLDIDAECAFDAVRERGDPDDADDACARSCARGVEPRVVHLRLEPAGVVVKRARFFAVDLRTVEDHDRCATRALGGLHPGDYTARVALWPEAHRAIEAPVHVLP